MSAMDEGTEAMAKALTESLHAANEWQHDDCDHGTYSGGLSHGEPYRMCEIMANRITSPATTFSDWLAAHDAQVRAEALAPIAALCDEAENPPLHSMIPLGCVRASEVRAAMEAKG